ncbi:TetR/AcrR family transcriptional regulator [Streptomyces sp. NPDC057245]|uniref:TetR/AcrR family transcriptional regulator n=1 Tax=Streptomyces sp. NPDC057245 TaxID=3346065 RepID=UPI0036423B47
MTKRLTRVERREQTRAGLVDAAIGLFASQGVSGVSVEAIAEGAGYSRGAYHSNFSGRDQLLDAVVQVVVSDLGAQLRQRTDGEERAIAKLSEYIRTFAAYCAREPDRTRALVAVVSHRTTTGGPDYDSMVDESLGDLIAIFEQGQDAGEMRRFDRVVMARLLRRALDGEAVRIAAEGPEGAVADELVANFVHATRA